MPYISFARWPPSCAYQVWRVHQLGAVDTPAAIDRSTDIARSAASSGASPASASHGVVHDRVLAVRPTRAPSTSAKRRQLARQVLDVHAGAAVDLGRVLAREQRDLHAATTLPLPTTVTPPSDTVNPRSRSASWSTPTARPARPRTFLSRIAWRTTALRPTSTPVHQHRVLDLGVRVQVHARGEHRPPRAGARDDHAGAHHRVERVAAPAVLVEHELRRRQRVVPA